MRKLRLPDRTRESPRLDRSDIGLIRDVGIQEMKSQARKFVEEKLSKDQTVPPKGNPVYKAMYACRCTSRKELKRVHGIPEEGELRDSQIDSVVNLLARWIAREYNFFLEEKSSQRGLDEFRKP